MTSTEKQLRAQITELSSEAQQQAAKFAALQVSADHTPLENQVCLDRSHHHTG